MKKMLSSVNLMAPMDHIRDAFHKRPVKLVAGRRYCVTPLTDHLPATQPELLEQIIAEASALVPYKEADCLVGEEDRGGFICSLLSIPWRKPFTLTKWNPRDLKGELQIDFRNAYTQGNLYLNGIAEHFKKVIIIEDMIDTGGTVVALVKLLRSAGVEVKDIFAVAEKADYGGVERIKKETGMTPKILVSFKTGDDVSEVIWRNGK